MNSKRKNKFSKIAFLLNGLLFLIAGIGLIKDSKLTLGILQLFAAMINLAMILNFKNEKIKRMLDYAILMMNIVVSLSIAVDYMLVGKSFIQYAWIIAAFVSLIALIKKRKALTSNSNRFTSK